MEGASEGQDQQYAAGVSALIGDLFSGIHSDGDGKDGSRDGTRHHHHSRPTPGKKRRARNSISVTLEEDEEEGGEEEGWEGESGGGTDADEYNRDLLEELRGDTRMGELSAGTWPCARMCACVVGMVSAFVCVFARCVLGSHAGLRWV